MKAHIISFVGLCFVVSCATPSTVPRLDEEAAEPVAQPAPEPPPPSAEEPKGEIDLGLGGEYGATQVEAGSTAEVSEEEPSDEEGEDDRLQIAPGFAQLGEACGGWPRVLCKEPLYCKTEDDGRKAVGTCEVEPVNGRRVEPRTIDYTPRPGYK